MTAEATPIPLTRDDITYLLRFHPMGAIQEKIDAGRFVIVEDGVENNGS
jgi:hypothetical protein